MQPYGCDWVNTPNFARLVERTVTFDNAFIGSMPCMPARRELHTGRYNFLHRSWGPLEPFDDSMPQILDENGIHTHKVTDHQHYWEDGGATYHTRFTTHEFVRGQEGDPLERRCGRRRRSRPQPAYAHTSAGSGQPQLHHRRGADATGADIFTGRRLHSYKRRG